MTAGYKIFACLLVFTGLLLTGSAAAMVEPDQNAARHEHGRTATDPVQGRDDPVHVHESGVDYDEKVALDLSQGALGHGVGDYTFLDGNEKQVSLESLRGKPVIISLIYTSCYHVCPTVTSNLARVVNIARDALGDDSFSVLTIGFDTPVDTPDRMRIFAAQRNIDLGNWHFVSTDADTLQQLAADVGFSYFSTPKGFDHMIQATLLDGEGKVYRQVYGMAPEAPALVEPLKELLYGKQVAATPIQGMLNNIKLFCTVYDPTTGMYRFDYSIFIGLFIGLVTLGGTAWFIIRAWRKSASARPLA
jgi:protein SCO1/2